jgi:UDP-N-acetylmuramyl pentapeptide synthase
MKGVAFENKKSIARYILDSYNENDAILVKAGRKDKLEEIINELKELVK